MFCSASRWRVVEAAAHKNAEKKPVPTTAGGHHDEVSDDLMEMVINLRFCRKVLQQFLTIVI